MEKVSDGWKSQYQRNKHLLGITRFDPYSIMMYPEDKFAAKRLRQSLVYQTDE